MSVDSMKTYFSLKELRLIPLILAVLINNALIVSIVCCILPYIGQYTSRDFDACFIKSFNYNGLCEHTWDESYG